VLILGLDQSITETGWALYRFPGSEKDMVCGQFSSVVVGRDPHAQCVVFGRNLKALIGKQKRAKQPIDFIAWERASRRITPYEKDVESLPGEARAPQWTVNAKQLMLVQIQGQIMQAAIDYSAGFEAVDVKTWRAKIFGVGGGNLTRVQAKARALEYCRWLGISVDGDNEAEAACVARWAATCSQEFRRLQTKEAA
jgi:hypothetical protein